MFRRLFVVAAVIVFGVVLFSVENTAKLLADLAATVVGPNIPQLTRASQSYFDTRDFSIAKPEPVGSDGPASSLIGSTHAAVEAPTSETLLRQFQAWAAEQDAQQLATAQLNQVSSSPKAISERAVEGTFGSTGPVQKERRSPSTPKAQPRVTPQASQKQIWQTQSARVQVAPAQHNGAKFTQAAAVRN